VRQALGGSERFDLWIIDRESPSTDVWVLPANVRARCGPVRAVMFSAHALTEHRDQALAASSGTGPSRCR
jgi:hypothetical protein